MNWYELADKEEVRQRLHDVFYTYNFCVWGYELNETDYHKAEALWGEYSEEFFD